MCSLPSEKIKEYTNKIRLVAIVSFFLMLGNLQVICLGLFLINIKNKLQLLQSLSCQLMELTFTAVGF
jgi:hypothetical protein